MAELYICVYKKRKMKRCRDGVLKIQRRAAQTRVSLFWLEASVGVRFKCL